MDCGDVLEIMRDKTGRASETSPNEEITFSVVGKSDVNHIVCMSDTMIYNTILFNGINESEKRIKMTALTVRGSIIDCSSLHGVSRITFFNINGKEVWNSKDPGLTTSIPARLPCALYTVKIDIKNQPAGSSDKIFTTLFKW